MSRLDLLLIQLRQLRMRAHDAELLDGGRPQLGILFALRGGKQAIFLSAGHERAEDPLLDVDVGAGGVDLGEQRRGSRARRACRGS